LFCIEVVPSRTDALLELVNEFVPHWLFRTSV
jgi:hypothetical protein